MSNVSYWNVTCLGSAFLSSTHFVFLSEMISSYFSHPFSVFHRRSCILIRLCAIFNLWRAYLSALCRHWEFKDCVLILSLIRIDFMNNSKIICLLCNCRNHAPDKDHYKASHKWFHEKVRSEEYKPSGSTFHFRYVNIFSDTFVLWEWSCLNI